MANIAKNMNDEYHGLSTGVGNTAATITNSAAHPIARKANRPRFLSRNVNKNSAVSISTAKSIL